SMWALPRLCWAVMGEEYLVRCLPHHSSNLWRCHACPLPRALRVRYVASLRLWLHGGIEHVLLNGGVKPPSLAVLDDLRALHFPIRWQFTPFNPYLHPAPTCPFPADAG